MLFLAAVFWMVLGTAALCALIAGAWHLFLLALKRQFR